MWEAGSHRHDAALGLAGRRGPRATFPLPTTCASRKDYLHCGLSLGKATILCTRCTPGILARRDPRNGTDLRTHREQPERPSQRQSPRRLVCVRMRRPAGHARPAVWAGACASPRRGSLPAGRPPRLNDAPGRSLDSRGPDSARDPGLFVFSSTSGVPLHSDVASTPGVSDAGCARRETRFRAARRRLRREGSRGGTAEVEVVNPKSRRRSRRATQTGRNDWAAPEPVTGTFCFSLDVAKWSKAPDCKSGGASPRRFNSDRRVQCLVR